jgi:hypothetical protein
LGFAALNVACGIFLFFAEGFEIAFAMIWPLRESAEADIRRSLQDLDPEFVLAQRQVIVVATITMVSLTSAFDWIEVPGLGRVHSYGVPALFSGLFTTLTVLWFGQVFPKRVAAKSAERFWRLSRWLLKPIVAAGKVLDLPAPSGDLVALWEMLFGTGGHCSHHESASLEVAQLWATCDCAVCNPNDDGARLASGPSLSLCNCQLCDSAGLAHAG